MLIGYDGGAFQTGGSPGMLNCSVGLLNAASELDPSFEFVLITDPRLGPLDSAALDRLTRQPEIIEAPVFAAYDPPRRGLLTGRPAIRFIVDDFAVAARREANWAWYEGPPPRRSFIIASRAARPCDVSDSGDTRPLGIALQRIVIDDQHNPPREISHGDPVLIEGFGGDELHWQWTVGRAVLPLRLFPDATTIRLGLELYESGHRYQLGGSFDRVFNRIETELSGRARRLALSKIASDLSARGVTLYMANHLLPAVIPGLKLAAWAYDIAPVKFPKHFDADDAARFQHNVEVIRQADCVFSISERTRADIIAELGVPAERVLTVGVDTTHDRPPLALERVTQVRQKYELADNYILCVGMLEPRNLHVRLVQAYHRFIQPLAAPPQLVIIGKSGGGYQPIAQEIMARELQQRVRILSDVNTEELSALYTGALFVAYPSLYDGFKLPVLEAMSYQKAILTSRASIMSEVAGDAALTVDPDDVDSIATALAQLTGDAEFRSELVRCGVQRRAVNNWPGIARVVLDRLHELTGT